MSQIKTIMTADEYGQALVTFARQTAQTLVRQGLTRSQIRNIFTEVRKVQALWETDKARARRRLEMLKPKLAYQTNRVKSVKHLAQVLGEAIDYVDPNREDSFRRFLELFEAILAYHRAEGGRN
ncbi:type III-A CRISPR-associated protein Csm2 [Candidatus Parcubacteria bacterium]|nr:MAG: type III-A CRISPR-associated protein Csm2 [Candidatus Parcubacteria bacterium]